MHPAWSIIFFTSVSGLGLGLAGWVVLGILDLSRFVHLLFVSGFTFALIGAGLLSSTLHLGHPERAWRALSQWRSSWLSREGVLALLVLAALSAWFLFVFLGMTPPLWASAALVALIIATVYATSMIYASLRTVACWHHPLTPVCYLMFSVSGGALAFVWLSAVVNQPAREWFIYITGGLIFTAWVVKFLWWRMLDTKKSNSSLASATGLGALGEVKTLMPPHTSENYLQTEMGFVVARRHAVKLRMISVFLGCILPLLGLYMAENYIVLLSAVLLAHLVGIFVERWLFFAEAKHVVSTYYTDITDETSPDASSAASRAVSP
jgi:DMSO reductase anchor subunit